MRATAPLGPAGELVIASGNAGKLREIRDLLAGLEVRVSPQSRFDVPEVDETGLSFMENALLKARNAAAGSGLPAIADDSGLEVDALNGAPGIYSARYAGMGASDQDNLAKLLRDLEEIPEHLRTARFHCVIVYLRHAQDPIPRIFQGVWEGSILFQPRGHNGFGYDPVFYIPTHSCSAAELAPALKNRLSHRAQALGQLRRSLSSLRA